MSLHHYLLTSSSLSPLAATLMNLPATVANKRLTIKLSPLDATLTKNTGGAFLGFNIPTFNLPTFQRLWLTPLSPIFRTLFQVPYPGSPLFATLTKTAGVCTNNSHSGTTSHKSSIPLSTVNLELSTSTEHGPRGHGSPVPESTSPRNGFPITTLQKGGPSRLNVSSHLRM